MLHLKNERVLSFSRRHLDVYWEISPTTEDVQEYEFYVERSQAEAGPFTSIAGPLTDKYFVRDNSVHLINAYRAYYYRIRVLHVPTGKEEYSKVIDQGGDHDLIALEIITNEKVLFEEFVGNKCFLFPRRTFGMRCPQCWNEILGKRTQDKCPTCFNTGFAGGYMHPVAFWAQIDIPEKANQYSIEDVRQTSYPNMRCGPSPEIKPEDLIIDRRNIRYRVVSVGGTFRLGVRVHQEVRLVEVQRGSIEDSIPLNINAADETFLPSRNFNNPQNFEGADENLDLDRVLHLYGY